MLHYDELFYSRDRRNSNAEENKIEAQKLNKHDEIKPMQMIIRD